MPICCPRALPSVMPIEQGRPNINVCDICRDLRRREHFALWRFWTRDSAPGPADHSHHFVSFLTTAHQMLVWCIKIGNHSSHFQFNRLTPSDPYMGRIAPLTSKRCILYIYSTNTGTEFFKHALYSPCFSLQNAVWFIMLTSLVPVLFTFYI